MTVAKTVVPKLVPLGKSAIRMLLGFNDVVRLLSRVERDVKHSSEIAHGKHSMVWDRVSAQRVDPEVAGCLAAYLTGGDIPGARAKLHARLGELLRFGDDAIDDACVVRLVVASIERNVSRAPLKDRDAMRLEFALTRAAIEQLAARPGADAAPQAVALEEAVVPVGENVSSPARLVRARSGVLPYAAREGLLAQLGAWLHGPNAFSACLVGGRGGSGKTRLGVELARQAARAGWLSGMLTAAPGVGAIEALVAIDTARLIVVDYAETRAEQLEVLLPWLAATATEKDPVRVLLLIRAAPRQGSDWTTALRHRSDPLDRVLDDVEQHRLEHLPLDLAERHALFSAAAAAFAMRRPAGAVPVAPPLGLGGPVFTSPLMVVIASYLAVHDSADAIPATSSAIGRAAPRPTTSRPTQ